MTTEGTSDFYVFEFTKSILRSVLSIKHNDLAVPSSLLPSHAPQARACCAGLLEAVGYFQNLLRTVTTTHADRKEEIKLPLVKHLFMETAKNKLN